MDEVCQWIMDETQGADFGDKRLQSRFSQLLYNLSHAPDKSIPSSNKGWSETLAAYRFIGHHKITPQKILLPHHAATLSRIQNERVVLIPQDTTDIDLSNRKKRDEFGYLSTENSQGLYLHPSIAFTPEGCCLGTTDFHMWIRKELGSRDERKKKPLEDKETFCWLRGYEAANEVAKASPNTVIVSISDREGDIYDVLEKLPNENNKAFWLIRCKHDRVVLDEESGKFDAKLKQSIQAADVLGHIEFDVPEAWVNRNSKARYARSGRRIKQAVKIKKMTLSPRKTISDTSEPVTIYVVHCKEVYPPKDEKPIEWYLLSSYPTQSIEEAITLIHWYLCRWQIEVFFKVLKIGCKVEELQFDSLRNTSNCIALYMIVTWRVLFLMMMGRNCPELCCELVFEKIEWQSVYAVLKKEKPPKNPPSLYHMVCMVAKLGGFLGRKSDGFPGPKVIWQGIQRMRDMAISWDAFYYINNI